MFMGEKAAGIAAFFLSFHPPPKINESYNELIFVENFFGVHFNLSHK